MAELINVGMVRLTDTGVLITEKGINCLHQLKEANAMLKKLGLDF
jgi:hypothetical protein